MERLVKEIHIFYKQQEICYTEQQILEKDGEHEQMAGKGKYTFESKIHVYRATKRMTQQELADLVGYPAKPSCSLKGIDTILLCFWHIVLRVSCPVYDV